MASKLALSFLLCLLFSCAPTKDTNLKSIVEALIGESCLEKETWTKEKAKEEADTLKKSVPVVLAECTSEDIARFSDFYQCYLDACRTFTEKTGLSHYVHTGPCINQVKSLGNISKKCYQQVQRFDPSNPMTP